MASGCRSVRLTLAVPRLERPGADGPSIPGRQGCPGTGGGERNIARLRRSDLGHGLALGTPWPESSTRRRPEAGSLYRVVQENLATLYGVVEDGALAIA